MIKSRIEIAFLVFILILALAMSACGEDQGPNLPPTLIITSGPVQGSEASYNVRISWFGSDPDGYVSRYEYAIDPPSAFTELDIAEGGPDLLSEFIPGENGTPDITRITKLVDGNAVSFDWVHTEAVFRRFGFSATQADSALLDSVYAPTGRFTDMHALYVRAVDDDGAVSPPDHVAFTATTLAPTSRIVTPNPGLFPAYTSGDFHFSWEGNDPDGASSIHFQFKLVRLSPDGGWVAFEEASHVLGQTGDVDWKNLDDTLDQITLSLGHEWYQYVLGIRAIDSQGAVEPFLETGRNVIVIRPFPGGKPLLTVSEPNIGTESFRGLDIPVEVEVVPGVELRFQWSATGELYGGQIWGYSWGVDLVNPELDGPGSGWSPWGQDLTHNSPPLVLKSPGLHTFFVRARDTAGGTTVAQIRLRVVPFPLDREVLFVDDSYDNTFPRDHQQDDFWQARFASYDGFDQVFEHDSHGPSDRALLSPDVPTLSKLGRHKLLVWNSSGWGYNGATSLVKVSAARPILGAYLRAGGTLWLSGRMNIGATQLGRSVFQGDFVYPKELNPRDFAYDFLKLRTSKIDNDKGADPKNTLREVQPFPGQTSPVYDAMFVDPSKLNPVQAERSGVSHVDAVFDPLFADAEKGFRGILESLYVYGATGNVFLDPLQSSGYHGRLTALRWHDPDPAREHGRIQWFGFPMYYFFDHQAQDTFNKSMDWFRAGP